jgi:hypothetical protein
MAKITIKNRSAILFSLFLLSACAVTTKFQGYPALTANAPTAIIHVVRSNNTFGGAITAPVYIDRYLIGRIGPGGHLATRVPVGRVHVTSTTGDAVIQTEKDGEYYVEVSMPVQSWFYAPDFNIVAINKQRAMEFMRSAPAANR